MKKNASPKQVARAIGVSESTLKRWCDGGLIPMTKTAGGHRRIEVAAVIKFLRETGRQVVEPELLNLPVTAGKTEWTLARAVPQFLMTYSLRHCTGLANNGVAEMLLFTRSGEPAKSACDVCTN